MSLKERLTRLRSTHVLRPEITWLGGDKRSRTLTFFQEVVPAVDQSTENVAVVPEVQPVSKPIAAEKNLTTSLTKLELMRMRQNERSPEAVSKLPRGYRSKPRQVENPVPAWSPLNDFRIKKK